MRFPYQTLCIYNVSLICKHSTSCPPCFVLTAIHVTYKQGSFSLRWLIYAVCATSPSSDANILLSTSFILFFRVQHNVTGTRFYRNPIFWKTGDIVYMSVSEQHVVTELIGSIGYGSDLYWGSAGI